MNSAVLALIGLICFGPGYKYYSRFIEKIIYGLNQADSLDADRGNDSLQKTKNRFTNGINYE